VYVRRRFAGAAVVLALFAAIGLGAYFALRPAEAPVRTGVSVTTTPPTSVAAIIPNGPPQSLELASKPVGAQLTITLQDKSTLTGTTPFSAQVPGGNVTISLAKTGYNTTVRELVLNSPHSLTVWLDPRGLLYQSLVRFKCGPAPKQVVFSPDGKELWVSLLSGHGIEVFDPTTGTKLDQVTLGKYGSVEMVFNRAGTRLYVSQMETASVYELDPATRKVLRVLKTGGSWTKVLLLSRDEKTLWASNWSSNDVSEIDLVTGKLVRRIKTVANPRGLYETPDGKRLFVAGFKNGEIQRIDLATGQAKVIFKKAGGSMRHMVADEQRDLLYLDDLTTNVVWVLDLATEKVTKLADTDQRPNTIGLSPDRKVLYVSCRGKDNPKTYFIPGPEWGSVLAIDTATGKILDAIVGGNQCTGLDVSPDGKLLVFSDFLDDTIRAYTIPDYEILAAGNGGRAVAHLKDLAKN
jgi:DNA-binding beta-propeller fold protein YncE